MHTGIRWLTLILTASAGLWLWSAARPLRGSDSLAGATALPVEQMEWPPPMLIQPDDWAVFQRIDASATGVAGALSERFRLAGTFSAYPGDAGTTERSRLRRAIVDDLRAGRQHLVQEGDGMDGVTVARIHADRVVLRAQDGEEETLWLSFSSGVATSYESEPGALDAAMEVAPLRFEDMPALATSRFGKQIGENRWVFSGEALQDYYDEVIHDPERLAAILLAMQPDFDDDDDVAGYQLELLGENVLYEAAGMLEGDIVRAVNSMPMTSPARAQYFISEFLKGNISAIVLDIERAGEESKLIYLIR